MPRQGGIWEPNSTLNTGNQVDGHCLQVLPLIHTVFLNGCIKTGQKANDVGIYQSPQIIVQPQVLNIMVFNTVFTHIVSALE